MIYKYTNFVPRGAAKGFVTPNRFTDALDAMRYLAVPYSPISRLRLELPPDVTLESLDPTRLDGKTRASGIMRRAWPAFGRHGGGWESEIGKEVAIEGTGAPRWMVDSPFIPAVARIRDADFVRPTEWGVLLSLLMATAEHIWGVVLAEHRAEDDGANNEKERGFKFPDDVPGGVARFTGRLLGEYSISFLAELWEDRAAKTMCVVGLRLWGATWVDDETQEVRLERRIIALATGSLPLEKPVPIPIARGIDIKTLLTRDDVRDFDAVIKNIRRTLVLGSRLDASHVPPCVEIVELPCPFGDDDDHLFLPCYCHHRSCFL